MHEVKTEIEIEASPTRVWQVLMDFPAHAQWNPFVRSISGTPAPGAKLDVRIQPEGGRAMRFKPRVLVADTRKEFRWRGQFLVPGLFDGEHYFQLQPLGPARTRLVHGELFSGLLVGMARSGLDGGTRAGFIAMNQALKSRAEAGAEA
ncbi:MAG: hypothetical protein JWQ76_241 [Ramlibacter sp.]|nr:hypothetical protein [Ramlibacter sp.]